MKYSSERAIRSSSSAISSLGLSPVCPKTSSATFLMSLARGSYDLYTRWPNPISRPSPFFTFSMKAGMFFLSAISPSISSTASLAPAGGRPVGPRDPRRDRRERVHVRGADAAHRAGGAVLLVVGVEDQEDLQRALHPRVGLGLPAARE